MAGTDILENNFKKLDDIVAAMEKGDLSLEEAFKLYKEGIDLVSKCNESIEKVEKEVVELIEFVKNETVKIKKRNLERDFV